LIEQLIVLNKNEEKSGKGKFETIGFYISGERIFRSKLKLIRLLVNTKIAIAKIKTY